MDRGGNFIDASWCGAGRAVTGASPIRLNRLAGYGKLPAFNPRGTGLDVELHS